MSIVNRDIRWGLFGLTINECWISRSAEEQYDGEESYDFEQDINEYEIRGVLLDCSNNVEIAINRSEYEKIGDIIQDCINEYAHLFFKEKV